MRPISFALVAITVLFGFLRTPAFAETVDRIDIVTRGIYAIAIKETVAAPGTAAGANHRLEKPTLTESTQTIPARVGLWFGFEFRIVGLPADGSAILKRTTIYPDGGVRNPATGKAVTRDEVTDTYKADGVPFVGFRFDHDWEMVPGIWTIEVSQDGKTLASQSFTVTKDSANSQ